jgi:hypothetical protein
LSATGQAIGVDESGRVAGVTSYERLRAAIQQADESDAGRLPSSESVPTP